MLLINDLISAVVKAFRLRCIASDGSLEFRDLKVRRRDTQISTDDDAEIDDISFT